MKDMKNMKKNEIFEARVEGYSSEAMGVCRLDGRAVFLPRALSGEDWELKLVKVGAGAVFARGLRLITPSPRRQEPDCPHFGLCGGCDTRHMSYEEELRFKLERVNSALEHIGDQSLRAEEIIGSDEISRYRNKGIFAVAEKDGTPAFGFYRERSHDLICINDCLLQSELSCRAAAAVTEFMRLNHIPAYHEENGKGLVRHVFCRQAVSSPGAVVCVIAAGGFGAKTNAFVAHMRSACPELTGIVLNVNKTRGNTVLSGDFYTLWGEASIRDRLCGLAFEIAPRAFFQINPPQAEKLYRRALEYAGKNIELAFDLYCGAGTISLCLAGIAKKVIGAEIIPEAIENAEKNAARNGIKNAEFICADAGAAALALAARGLRPEVIVVDPPRKGMNEAAIEAVASMNPDRIVYVSCNPATLARDIKRFNALGYTLRHATAVDMFPRTAHVETVVLLSKLNTKQHIEVELNLDELDLTSAESKATYDEIKAYVLEKHGLKVSSLYISQVKRKCGLDVGQNYNLSKKEDAKVPQCPPEKEAAIIEALKHFRMI